MKTGTSELRINLNLGKTYDKLRIFPKIVLAAEV